MRDLAELEEDLVGSWDLICGLFSPGSAVGSVVGSGLALTGFEVLPLRLCVRGGRDR